MVGFPGESDDDHAQTLELIEATEMLAVHAFRWSPRPGTPATELGSRVPDSVARGRSAEVRRAATISGRARRLRAVGRRTVAVWDRVEDGQAHGFTDTYLDVVAAVGADTPPGSSSPVELVAVEGDALRARLLHR